MRLQSVSRRFTIFDPEVKGKSACEDSGRLGWEQGGCTEPLPVTAMLVLSCGTRLAKPAV